MSSALQKLVVVTGASRGIGRAVSEALLRQGVSVLGVARSSEQLQATLKATESLHSTARFIPCAADLTRSADVQAVYSAVKATDLELVGLVNNAGALAPLARIADVNISELRSHFDINVVAVAEITQLLLPLLRAAPGKGRVVNVSSGAASHAYVGWGAYCVSKAALNMLTSCLAVEEPDVVAVALRPGVVDTEMQALIRSEDGRGAMVADQHKKFTELHRTGTLLRPEQPAAVIAGLVLGAEDSLSGAFYSWDSPEVAKYALKN
ncbi:hypothetical protein GGI07_001743 [Coemansia sp. Benny D115]|nr:hypothetical protein GGI07_001743 [Coemansia sp. Benny D115]